MFRKLLLGLTLAFFATASFAQTCPTRPLGDSTNACADTKFVANAIAAIPPPSGVVSSIDAQTGTFTTGNGIDSSGKVIELTAARRTLPTTQSLTTGTAATYTRPANVLWIEVTACGGGGGGVGVTNASSSTVNGTTGGTTSFNSVTAVGGSPGNGVIGGIGGTGGTGAATRRQAGSPGSGTIAINSSISSPSGVGGGSILGSGGVSVAAGGVVGANALVNSCGGGSGATGGSASFVAGGGAGAGEGFYLIINSPASTYTYTIGAKGTGGAGVNQVGGDGGSGFIFVVEHYGS